MTRKIVAHFDGKVIVPDEAVDLPVDQPLRVELSPLSVGQEPPGNGLVQDRLRRLARVTGCLSGPSVSSEALRRENLYD
jgi:hypothetical protein